MYKHLVVNAFPRSGSVFFANVLSVNGVYGAQTTSFHLPHIIGNENVDTIVVIRNPYECISSLLYKNHNPSENHNCDKIDICYKNIVSESDQMMDIHLSEYLLYVNKCLEHNGSKNLYIVDFNEMQSDSGLVFQKVAAKFGLKYNYDNSKQKTGREIDDIVKNRMLAYGLMTDNDGHMPREKTDLRHRVDSYINELESLKPVYDQYKYLIDNIKN
jgi:hypothetical protein